MILLKLLIFILAFGGGVAFIKYNYQLTQLFGHNSLAEQYLGNGGTYTMWKLLGVILIFGAIIYLFR